MNSKKQLKNKKEVKNKIIFILGKIKNILLIISVWIAFVALVGEFKSEVSTLKFFTIKGLAFAHIIIFLKVNYNKYIGF